MNQVLKFLRQQMEDRIHEYEPRAVLDEKDFPWSKQVEAAFPQIKQEAEAAISQLEKITNFDSVLPNQRALYQGDAWKSFFIKALGKDVPEHAKMCPHTASALNHIPGLINAFYSIHRPGIHIPPHRGPHAGILRYHLGLIIPEGDVAIKVNGQVCRWQEGKSLFFDDSFEHEAWNKTNSIRIILFVDMVRPLPAHLSIPNQIMLKLFEFTKQARDGHEVILKNQLSDVNDPQNK